MAPAWSVQTLGRSMDGFKNGGLGFSHGVPPPLLRALNKSLAARSSLFWAVCGVANPRHSWAMAVVYALQPIPNQGAHTREDLFSIALDQPLEVFHDQE